MDNIQNRVESFRPSKRKLIQLYSAVLYNAHLRGFVDGEIYQGQTKNVCVPGLNCYSCPGAVGACPLGAIQNALASSGHRAGWYVLGLIMIFGLCLGRTICGWLCPMGLVQELLHKIPTPKIKKSRVTRALSWLKYVILVVFAGAVPLWYGLRHGMPVPGFCKYICPAGTFEGAIGLLSNPGNSSLFSMLGIYFTRKFVILMIICAACIFCYRSFCRFLCPLGAIYGIFNKLALVGVKVDEDRCNGCGACVRTCKMDIRHVGDHECIGCAGCMKVCAQSALSLKAGSYTILAPQKGCAEDTPESAGKRESRGRAAWIAALAVLCFALVWFNFLDPSVRARTAAQAAGAQKEEQAADAPDEAQAADAQSEEQAADAQSEEQAAAQDEAQESTGAESDAAIGTAVGDRMQDFTAQCLDGSSFHLADQRGKVVVINMWATYCGPCVKELPVFDKFYREHKEDAVVLAVHASDVLEDVPEFLEPRGLEIPFCIDDEENDTIFTLSGASPSLLPHTVVLNRKGEIIYNQTGAMTEELLVDLYNRAK